MIKGYVNNVQEYSLGGLNADDLEVFDRILNKIVQNEFNEDCELQFEIDENKLIMKFYNIVQKMKNV